MGGMWVGIDTGGTFTDLVLVDWASGTYHYHKLPTTTADPSRAILEGIAHVIGKAGGSARSTQFLVLGTTLATNAVLEGKWARTGLITTEGFRDVLELARQRRPHYFNLDIPKPVPPAAHGCRLEVGGRIAFDGAEVTPLDEAGLRHAIRSLREQEVEAVAVCFLHAYANPVHERKARALLAELWPEAYACTSSDVLAEFREFERFATTVVNASLMPVMDRYLERFEGGVKAMGIRAVPRVMQSNGGAVSPGAVRRLPINTFFSGPAGGVIGGVGLGRQLKVADLITFDMGGTSTDVCLIRGGEPAKKNERSMGGFPVRTRTLDIHTIGAGGGSIAWVDAGGLLKVGPMSAGAYPGPAAYGRGGEKPTVTDANVVLGRLNPRALLGGRMEIHPERARRAMERELTPALGIDAVRAAAGILEIINVNMMGAVRVISIEQGEDPRGFRLVAFGGAGPLHAADVARNMGMRHVLVPPRPGLLSALGLLHADVRGDFSLTRLVRAEARRLGALNDGFRQLKRRGQAWLEGEGEAPRAARFEWLADLRYFGQNSELILDAGGERLDARALARLVAAFHKEHKACYGYDMKTQPVEVVTLRLTVTVRRRVPPPEPPCTAHGPARAALTGRRRVWFPETGFVTTPVYDRERLPAPGRITGPAIIEQMDTTTVVPPGARVVNDRLGYLHMELPAPAGRRPG
jgi:N-methylhydantoinase A